MTPQWAALMGSILTLLLIIAVASRQWHEFESGDFKVLYGLFSAAVHSDSTRRVVDLDSSTVSDEAYPRLQATRGFVILAILISTAGTIVASKQQNMKMAGVCFGMASFCCLVSTSTYASYYRELTSLDADEDNRLRICYGFNIIAGLLALVLAVRLHRAAAQQQHNAYLQGGHRQQPQPQPQPQPHLQQQPQPQPAQSYQFQTAAMPPGASLPGYGYPTAATPSAPHGGHGYPPQPAQPGYAPHPTQAGGDDDLPSYAEATGSSSA